MSLTQLSNELKAALANRFPEGGKPSLENQESTGTDVVVPSIEQLEQSLQMKAKALEEIHASIEALEENSSLEQRQALEANFQDATEATVEALDQYLDAVVSTEGRVAAAVGGGISPVIAGGIIGHKLENAVKQRDALKLKLEKAKDQLKELKELHHPSSEGFKGAATGAAAGVGAAALNVVPGLGIGVGAGAAHAAWRKVEEVREEITKLEKELRKVEDEIAVAKHRIASREDIDGNLGLEGRVGATVGAFISPAIAGTVIGHKLQKAVQQRDALKAEIEKIEKELHDRKELLHAAEMNNKKGNHSEEGFSGGAAGFVAGAAATAIPVVGNVVAAGAANGTWKKIEEVREECAKLEEKITKLKDDLAVVNHQINAVKHAHESYGASPVVDEATVADPEGGEKIVEVAGEHVPEQNAEDALLAVNDASAAIDSSMRESTELEDAAAGLESILSSIAEYPQGLTPKDAEFVNVNLESIVGDWGLGQKLCPSIESFGGTNLRREATASLEANVREVLKSVYDYVVEMFKKFGELIAAFYEQLFNASKAVARRGEALTQRVAGIQVDTPTKNVVDIGSLASRLTINGQMPSLTAAMGAVMQEIEGALELENHVQAIESAVGSAAAHLRGLKDDTFSSGFEEVSTAYLSATKAPPIFAANGEVLQTRVFPGEISYVAEQKEGHWRFRVIKTGKEPQGSVIHVPSKGDLGKLGDRLKSEGQKAGAGIKDISDRIKTDKGQRFLAQIQGPSNSLNDENQRAIAKFVQQCAEDVKAIHALGKEMLTNSAKSMMAVVRVGEISCDLYKAPKAEAAPAADKAAGEAPAAPAAGEGGEAPAAA